jgi:hypothetical protein
MSTLHKDLNRCYFCEAEFRMIGPKGDQWYAEEVGEFWNKDVQDSVLAHPDCTPFGIDAIFTGEDPVWSMA